MLQLQSLFTETLRGYTAWMIVFAILTTVELLTPRERQSLTSRAMGLVYSGIWIPLSAILGTLLSVSWSLLGITPLLSIPLVQSLPGGPAFANVAAVGIGVVAADFAAYWYHRAQHVWLWPFHAVHHSIRELNAVNSYHHASENLFNFVLVAIPASLISADCGTVIPLLALFQWLQGVYLHSPTRVHFGPFRAIVADNRFHRIHHSLEERHFDKNFGILFSFWDRMFGTAHFPQPEEWPEVGLGDVGEPRTVREWLDLPLRLYRSGGAQPARDDDSHAASPAAAPLLGSR